MQRLTWFLTISIFLIGVSLITYSGYIESGDGLHLYGGVASTYKYQDWLTDMTADEKPPPVGTTGLYPLVELVDDPLSIFLALPLYAIAYHTDGIGLVHTVWLLNVIVSGVIGGVLYLYALELGYKPRVGIMAALVFGVGSIIATYSKSFFQEPLTALMILLAGLAIERWRKNYRAPLRIVWVLLALVAIYLSKRSNVIAYPALLLLMLPTAAAGWQAWAARIAWGRAQPWLFGGVLLLWVLCSYVFNIGGIWMYLWLYTEQWPPLLVATVDATIIALQAYLFSPGGSFWGTSPILLLLLPSVWLAFRAQRTQYLWVGVVLISSYAFAYALIWNTFWFAGLSWPPRFLIPMVPLLMVACFPSLDYALHAAASWRRAALRAAIGVLTLYGMWIQFTGLMFRWTVYPQYLPPDTAIDWGGGLNVVQYFRWFYLPRLWGFIDWDFAWFRTLQPLWLVIFIAFTLVSGAWLLWRWRRIDAPAPPRRSLAITALLAVALLVCMYGGLRLIYIDPLYHNYQPQELRTLFGQVADVTSRAQHDVVFFSSRDMRWYIYNYLKTDSFRAVGLGYLRGERYNPLVPPQVTSDNTADLLDPTVPSLLDTVAAQRRRVWYMAELGPFQAWAVRPVERYLSERYYSARQFSAGGLRALEYATTPAPQGQPPQQVLDWQFDQVVRLQGITLPNGTAYQRGDYLPISFYWSVDAATTTDYTMAWYLARDGAVMVQGVDLAPNSGLTATSTMQLSQTVQDNRALYLGDVAALPAGEYQVWVVLYRLADGTPQNATLNVGDAGQVLDGQIGVLPLTITIGDE
jgi:hypothetical protein